MRVCPHCSKPILRDGEQAELKAMRIYKLLTTAGQARICRISKPAASNRLAKWHARGFLKRTEVVQKSGGIEYHYTHLYPDRKPRAHSNGGEE